MRWQAREASVRELIRSGPMSLRDQRFAEVLAILEAVLSRVEPAALGLLSEDDVRRASRVDAPVSAVTEALRVCYRPSRSPRSRRSRCCWLRSTCSITMKVRPSSQRSFVLALLHVLVAGARVLFSSSMLTRARCVLLPASHRALPR